MSTNTHLKIYMYNTTTPPGLTIRNTNSILPNKARFTKVLFSLQIFLCSFTQTLMLFRH